MNFHFISTFRVDDNRSSSTSAVCNNPTVVVLSPLGRRWYFFDRSRWIGGEMSLSETRLCSYPPLRCDITIPVIQVTSRPNGPYHMKEILWNANSSFSVLRNDQQGKVRYFWCFKTQTFYRRTLRGQGHSEWSHCYDCFDIHPLMLIESDDVFYCWRLLSVHWWLWSNSRQSRSRIRIERPIRRQITLWLSFNVQWINNLRVYWPTDTTCPA